MGKRLLTNNSQENDIAAIISGDNIYSIPYFQRAYKWKPDKIKQLNQDILSLVDENMDFHFLGALIIHGRRTNPSEPDLYDVIDGQQRITTLFLYLCAIVKTLCIVEEHQEAAGLMLKYLLISRETGTISNFKLHPCKDDRSQLNYVYSDIINDKKMSGILGKFEIKPLPNTGRETGPLRNNYRSILRFVKDEYEQGGLERIRSVYDAVLNRLSVVQIDVLDPLNGPKIFDSLNSQQEPITIGDLVRNEIFSKVAAEEVDVIERIDSEYWQPFYKKFEQNNKNYFDAYFFPYGLILRPNIRKSEVYATLRKEWSGKISPDAIIKQLSEYQDAFLDIISGNNYSGHDKDAAFTFNLLFKAGLPSSTYPFLMKLSRELAKGSIDSENIIEILQVVESFLVRRATCGHEPTGLHAVFKKLWDDCDGVITSDRIIKEISKHKTVVWPDDEAFKKAIETRPLYSVNIAPYLILEFDRSLKGDVPNNIPWIEHVLPLHPEKSWFEIFSKQEHENMKNLIANLIPLSSEMNASLGNKNYPAKKSKYEEDSMFKSARNFAKEHTRWTPKELIKRSEMLSAWAIERWPHNSLG